MKTLIEQNRGKKLCLFWDNASVHKGHVISDYLTEINDLKVIQNIVYEPELNGIECLWAKMKYLFRSKLTEFKVKQEPFELKNIIEEIWSEIKTSEIKKIAGYGWINIFTDKRNPRNVQIFQKFKI